MYYTADNIHFSYHCFLFEMDMPHPIAKLSDISNLLFASLKAVLVRNAAVMLWQGTPSPDFQNRNHQHKHCLLFLIHKAH